MNTKPAIFSANLTFEGKFKKHEKGYPLHPETGKFFNPSADWTNFNGSVEFLFELISNGHAISTHLRSGDKETVGPFQLHYDGGEIVSTRKKGYRAGKNFHQGNLAFVDIDDGNTVEDSINDPFFKQYGCGWYTSPSFTEENQKHRLVFLLENVLTDEQDMRYVLSSLIRKFGGDEACKDGARIFFGAKGCNFEFNKDKEIPSSLIAELIEEEESHQHSIVFNDSYTDYQASDEERQYVIDSLSNNFLGNYKEWFSVACGLHHGGYSLQDFTAATVGGMMNQKSENDCKRLWTSIERGQSNRKITMGTVWKIIGGKSKFYDLQPPKEDDDTSLIEAINKTKKEIPAPIEQKDDTVLVEIEEGGIEYNEKYTKEVPLQPGCFFVKSPKGSGKTYQLEKLVQDAKDKKKSVLLIGHRVNLLSSMAQRLGLVDYKTVDWDKNKQIDYLAICVNSMPRISLRSTIKSYDVVLIDEAEQVLQHVAIQNGTIKPHQRKEITRPFFNVVKKAKSVYALDADLSSLTIDCISSIREFDLYDGHINVNKVKGRKLKLYDNKTNLIHSLEREIESGRSVFLATNSKNFVDWFSDYLQAKNQDHTKITSENSDTQKIQDFIQWVGHATDDDVKGKIILASPSLGTGVDIQAKFDHVFGLFEGTVNTHYDIDQQLHRVRNPKDVSVWIDIRKFTECEEWEQIKNNLLEDDVKTRKLVDYTLADVREPWFDMLLNLNARVTAYRNRSMNNLRNNFKAMKESQGWEIEFIEKYEEEFNTMDLKELRKANREKLKKVLKLSRKMNIIEFNEVNKKKKKNQDEKFSCLRYEIEDFFKEDLNKFDEIIDWWVDRKHTAIIAWEHFTMSDDELKRLDKEDLKRRHIIDRKNRALKNQLLVEGLYVLELGDKKGINTEHVLSKQSDQVKKFVDWAKINKKIIKQNIGLKVDGKQATNEPMSVVKSFLAKMGVETNMVGTTRKGREGNKIRLYQVNDEHIGWLNKYKEKRKGIVTTIQQESPKVSINHLTGLISI